jgi:hypothetical protein
MSATDISQRDVIVNRRELALPQANSPGFRFQIFASASELAKEQLEPEVQEFSPGNAAACVGVVALRLVLRHATSSMENKRCDVHH